MEKKYFYIKSDEYDKNSTLYKMDLNDINSLASFAITLEPMPEVRECYGYFAALIEFFKKNKNNLSNHFSVLDSSSDSKRFFCTMIDLLLFEKKFRNIGLNDKNIEAYNNCIQKYQHQLKENEDMYLKSEEKHI
ncbi:MAG: hypothetical protein E7170_01270 [Firmicutes bacterium]|nr:hypothetical protein [Bacillota bacterium]